MIRHTPALNEDGSDPGTAPARKAARFRCPAVFFAAAMAVLAAATFASALDPATLPTGENIVSGQGSITRSGSSMTVNQQSQRLTTYWDTFNIGRDAWVSFLQPGPGSVALNRILNQNPSQIFGRLTANGQVFLVNPAGIYFGPTAQVNVGSLVASTLNLADQDFLIGNYAFDGTGSRGKISNEGTIRTADGGFVAFLSPEIVNTGTVTADRGTVLMAAGDRVNLDFAGDGLVNWTVGRGVVDALAENRGLIRADGGSVVLTARAVDALHRAVVNNTGVIEARTLENRSGRILLLSDMEHGEVVAGGRLDASAPSGGDGGFIETSAAKVTVKDGIEVTTLAPQGRTGLWLIDPRDFTIAASGGDMTGAAVTSALQSTDLTIQSSQGNTEGNGDIFVNDEFSWSGNTLTLSAYRNIYLNSILKGSGTAKLALEYGQGFADGVINGTPADYYLDMWNGARIDLPRGENFSTKLGSGGTKTIYTVITELGEQGSETGTDLQGMGMNEYYRGNFVLGADIDASSTKDWNGGAGFEPIRGKGNHFAGRFDGLGHSIKDLFIKRSSDEVGLFKSVYLGQIQNVRLENVAITGQAKVGGLVGRARDSNIRNIFTSGAVKGGTWCVGGVAGYLENVTFSFSGGYNTGAVTGEKYVGGVIGYNLYGAISNSYNAGAVTGDEYVGGVAGYVHAPTYTKIILSSSGNSGAVTGKKYVGGVAGSIANGITSSNFNTGAVKGGRYVGGVAGYLELATFSDGYNAGAVTGDEYVGGVAGVALATPFRTIIIGSSYNSGTVTGKKYVGGLVGSMAEEGLTVSNSYNSGAVKGDEYVGGLVGQKVDGSVQNSFWDTETSGQSWSDGGTGRTTAEMKSLATYADAGWDVDNQGGTGKEWRIYDGYTYPLLRSFLKSATAVVTGGQNKVYDGTTAVSGGSFVWAKPLADPGRIYGTATYTTDRKDAGMRRVVMGGFYSDQQGFDIAFESNVQIEIMRKDAVLSFSGRNKVYDGTTAAEVAGSLSGVIAGDSATVLVQDANFSDKNAGIGKTITFDRFTLGGTDISNYNVTNTDIPKAAAADITPREISASYAGQNKVYDGTTAATVTNGSLSGIIAGDTVTILGQKADFSDKNAGIGKKVYVDVSLGGQDGGNYLVKDATTSADITPKEISASYTGQNKVYDGTTAATVTNGSLSGVIAGDTVTILGQRADFSDKNAGIGKTITVGNISLGGQDGGNYLVKDASTTADITRASLTITANDDQRRYSGKPYTGGNGVTYRGFVSGETSADLSGSLIYGGSSQGAVDIGEYVIAPSGLTSKNYNIKFNDGTLTIDPPISSPSSPGGRTGFAVEALIAAMRTDSGKEFARRVREESIFLSAPAFYGTVILQTAGRKTILSPDGTEPAGAPAEAVTLQVFAQKGGSAPAYQGDFVVQSGEETLSLTETAPAKAVAPPARITAGTVKGPSVSFSVTTSDGMVHPLTASVTADGTLVVVAGGSYVPLDAKQAVLTALQALDVKLSTLKAAQFVM